MRFAMPGHDDDSKTPRKNRRMKTVFAFFALYVKSVNTPQMTSHHGRKRDGRILVWNSMAGTMNIA